VRVSAGGCNEQSACVFVASTGLPTAQAGDAFTIVPNPAIGPFLIETRMPGTIRIHDARGQLVLVHQSRAGRHTIDAVLAPGVYLARLDGLARAQRLLVE
jgi:hypothetical protein